MASIPEIARAVILSALTLARYLLAILMFGVGAVYYSDMMHAAGILLMVGAVLMFPPTGNEVGRKLGGQSKVRVAAAGIFVGIVAAPIVAAFTQPPPEQIAALEESKAAKKAIAAEAEAKRAKADAERLAQNQRREAEAERRKACSDTITAFVMSQEFVKDSLRSPSTADFPYITASGVQSSISGDCKFTVSAYVDAQNAFGAMIRTKYVIDMEYLPDQRQWYGSNLRM